MRKWQQDLVQDSDIPSEIPEKIPEKTEIELSDTHISVILFLLSVIILIVLKPPIVLLRHKERPEETPQRNWSAILFLGLCISGLYWALQNKMF